MNKTGNLYCPLGCNDLKMGFISHDPHESYFACKKYRKKLEWPDKGPMKYRQCIEDEQSKDK
jgi:hypothetical protein